MNNSIYLAKDFNFDEYDYNQLDLICKYRLPILSDFPKLIIFLHSNTTFNEWINKKSNNITEHSIIHKLISIIKTLTINSRNEIFLTQIDIRDDELWKKIIDYFTDNNRVHDSVKKNLSRKRKT